MHTQQCTMYMTPLKRRKYFKAHQVSEHPQCLYTISLFVYLCATMTLFCSLVAAQIITNRHAKLKVMVKLFPALNKPTQYEDVVSGSTAPFIPKQ